MSTKRFSDTDAGAIIQRATELHASAGSGSHLTIEDVEHIAAEMGVPAEYVRAAAQELKTHQHDRRFNPFAIVAIRAAASIEGPVDDERWAHIVQLLRRHLGGAGETEAIGSVRYWNRSITDMGSEIARNDASVTSREDISTIEISRTGVPFLRVLAQIGGTVAGGALYAALLTALGVEAIVGIAGTVGGAIAGFAIARLAVAAWSRRQRRRLRELADHIAASVRLAEPSTAGEVVAAVEGRVDLLEGVGSEPEPTPATAAKDRVRS